MKDNWYIVLGLEFDPPVNDEEVIKAQIEKKQRFWASLYNDFRMGNKYKVWHQSLNQIRKDMLGEENIRARLAAEAEQMYYAEADSMLTALAQKGFVTEPELKRLAEKKSIPAEKLLKRAEKKHITVKKQSGSLSMYEKYKTDFAAQSIKYRSADSLLDSFGCQDIYEFLFGSSGAASLPFAAVKQKAQVKSREFVKNSPLDSAGKKLCGFCESFFSDESGKRDYDSYLKNGRADAVFTEIKGIADISGALAPEQSEYYLEKLSGCFADQREMLGEFCAAEDIKVLPQENMKQPEPAKKAPEREPSPEERLAKADILYFASDRLIYCPHGSSGYVALPLYSSRATGAVGEAAFNEMVTGGGNILCDVRSALAGIGGAPEKERLFSDTLAKLKENAAKKGLMPAGGRRSLIYTLPASSSDLGAENIGRLAEEKGFEALACADEVHAALLAYCKRLEAQSADSFSGERTILVYFLTGRIFETAVYKVSKRRSDGQLMISTAARACIDRFGTADWLKAAFQRCKAKFTLLSGAPPDSLGRAEDMELYKLIKELICGIMSGTQDLGRLHISVKGYQASVTIGRKDIDQAVEGLENRCYNCIYEMLRSRAIRVTTVTDIVMCTDMPLKSAEEGLEDRFGRRPFCCSDEIFVPGGARLCAKGYGEMV